MHLDALREMAAWGDVSRILPNHGDPAVIEAGGYDTRLIGATARYVAKLQRCRAESQVGRQDLATFIADDVASNAVRYFAAYEPVHRRNVAQVTGGIA